MVRECYHLAHRSSKETRSYLFISLFKLFILLLILKYDAVKGRNYCLRRWCPYNTMTVPVEYFPCPSYVSSSSQSKFMFLNYLTKRTTKLAHIVRIVTSISRHFTAFTSGIISAGSARTCLGLRLLAVFSENIL